MLVSAFVTLAVYFNPHPHVEGDLAKSNIRALVVDFNPHPHVEGDETQRARGGPVSDFNPHPHVEGDVNGGNISVLTLEFQSTPSRGG